ncbi:hypothetical protein FA95DRAFT_66096 [Auriscalpium vulgare]|uniref:Uncharacterized protein n=1 Tax=Auriscalpium vulgare TaxID=40419 RepID=A0ACB8S7R7_9AGAM|nr:hypothetical protein FA95DRAFT_66096 [Auriscalpium vulgare]
MSPASSAPTAPPKPKDAGAPFNSADADIILRTCDGVDYRAHKVILRLASSVFADMFSLPQPADDGVPIVPVTENARALELVLRWCYPVVSPDVQSLEDIRAFLEVSRKYVIGTMDRHIEQALAALVQQDPWGAFDVASTYGLRGVAAQAAVASLKRPLVDFSAPDDSFPTTPVAESDLIRHYETCRRGVPAAHLPQFDELVAATVARYAQSVFDAYSRGEVPCTVKTLPNAQISTPGTAWPSAQCYAAAATQLIMYQVRCSRAVRDMMARRSWLFQPSTKPFLDHSDRMQDFISPFPQCKHCWVSQPLGTYRIFTYYAPNTVWEYLKKVEDALVVRPFQDTLEGVKLMPVPCQHCRKTRDWHKFFDMVDEIVARELKVIIGKVPLPLCE